MATVDEELLARKEEFEARQQQDRQQQQEEQQQTQGQQRSLKGQATDQLKQVAKQQVKKVAKKALMQIIISTSPYWGTALLILLAIAFVVGVVIIAPAAICNSSYTDSLATGTAKAGLTLAGVCDMFQGGRSGGGGASGSYDVDFVLTSAYRPGATVGTSGRPSAHARGEAVDIALRPVPTSLNDDRIDRLFRLAIEEGFTPEVGDTLDEYRKPTELATGGHIHIEFNTYTSRGKTYTYCDDTEVSSPPTDLVDIPSAIARSGTSVWKLRPCMLNYVEDIFAQASAGTTNPAPSP